jgi:type VI secretion system protein ImpC
MSMSMDFRFGKGGGPRRREPSDTTRVLIIGDFLGDTPPLEPRRPAKVDITDVDALVAKLRPSLTLNTAGAPRLEFRSLDDFHPDALLTRVPALAELVNLRKRLDHPSTSVATAAELRSAAATASPAKSAPAESGSLFANLIGGAPAGAKPAETPLQATGIDSLIANIVAPHVSAGRDPAADDMVRVTDAVIAAGMRELLHHARFRSLEAAYRGLTFLTSRSEADSIDYYVLHATKDELLAEARSGGTGFLANVLEGGGRGFSLVTALVEFTDADDDLVLLAGLSVMTQEAGALLLAGASPMLAGATRTAELPRLRTSVTSNVIWKAFRDEHGAPHVGLALPRFLLRTPYGKRTDPIDAFAFEELEGLSGNDGLLWGNAALVVTFALLVAHSSGNSAGGLDVDDLPHVITKKDGESALVPSAEVLLSEPALDAIIQAGLMPLSSDAQRAAVKFVRAQSIASPPTALGLGGE